MNLTGDRNQCPSCGEFFNSTTAFAMHRTGEFGKDRRCLTVAQMAAKGMCQNEAGFWMTKPMSPTVRLLVERAGDSRG